MTLAEQLRSAREEKGLSQEAVGALVGVSRQAVTRWERGQSAPSTANLLRLCELYGLSPDRLCGSTPALGAGPALPDEAQLLQLLEKERSLLAAKRRRRALRRLVCAAAVFLGYAALYLLCRLVRVPFEGYTVLGWLFGSEAAREAGYLYGWLCQQGFFLYSMLFSVLAAAAGFWRLSAVTLSGFVLGLILGECFGPNPAGAALGMGHYGWLIWGAVFLLFAGAGAFAEIFCRRRQRRKQRSKKAKGS